MQQKSENPWINPITGIMVIIMVVVTVWTITVIFTREKTNSHKKEMPGVWGVRKINTLSPERQMVVQISNREMGPYRTAVVSEGDCPNIKEGDLVVPINYFFSGGGGDEGAIICTCK